MDKVFWGERTTPWSEVREDALRTFFSDTERIPFVLIGQVAAHFKCGLQEAEMILNRLKEEGLVCETSGEEAQRRLGVAFAYEPTILRDGQVAVGRTPRP